MGESMANRRMAEQREMDYYPIINPVDAINLTNIISLHNTTSLQCPHSSV
jgi:hypothetical protein